MKAYLRTVLACLAIVAAAEGTLAQSAADISSESGTNCPIVIPQAPVFVAPGQPEIAGGSTVGIINALCDVTLNFVNCRFIPTEIAIVCDTNGDGEPELLIPLKDIKVINALLVRATIKTQPPQLPGTGFPLACCGGTADLVLTRRVPAADWNAFGEFVQTLKCSIDLGVCAPVVVSASPSGGDCSIGQNIIIVGSCFILPDGRPNVTRIFAVNRDAPAEVIDASTIVPLNQNLLDAFFEFPTGSDGKSFLIFASGPNGTSRNLTSVPEGTSEGCPTGNEQGIQVSFTCRGSSGAEASPSPAPKRLLGCAVKRKPSGAFVLILETTGVEEGVSLNVGTITPKKIAYKKPIEGTGLFRKLQVKGAVCGGLPGPVLLSLPGGETETFQCAAACSQ